MILAVLPESQSSAGSILASEKHNTTPSFSFFQQRMCKTNVRSTLLPLTNTVNLPKFYSQNIHYCSCSVLKCHWLTTQTGPVPLKYINILCGKSGKSRETLRPVVEVHTQPFLKITGFGNNWNLVHTKYKALSNARKSPGLVPLTIDFHNPFPKNQML